MARRPCTGRCARTTSSSWTGCCVPARIRAPANRYGVTPLNLAAINGSAAMIERLLAAGADANEVSKDGETALMTVARVGSVDAAKVLLERGADGGCA